MKKLKKIPKFKNEDEEFEFWSTHDTTEHVDWSKAKRIIFPNLKPSSQSVAIRFPKMLIDRLKMLANKKDVPYQSLLKTYLAERIEREFQKV